MISRTKVPGIDFNRFLGGEADGLVIETAEKLRSRRGGTVCLRQKYPSEKAGSLEDKMN
jgi:hypothetical protein